jgi:hypothetical protein
MAKFLTTKHISYELEELIKGADSILYIVSPYLKLSKDFQELIFSRNKKEKKTIIIYGKRELTSEQSTFLTGLRFVYLKYHENLHAKCYLNDSKMIITSLNFYEYSMINNKEIGVLYELKNPIDDEIYNQTLEHIKFIEDNSIEKPFEITNSAILQNNKIESPKIIDKQTGFCIRTGNKIPFDKDKPFSKEAYHKWNEYGNGDHAENFCHYSGEPSHGETSFNHPILQKNWKKAKEIYNL